MSKCHIVGNHVSQLKCLLIYQQLVCFLFQWGVTPLMDNFPNDQHLYIIKVYTGFRINSATDSRILFQLSGDRRDTGVRRLTDGIRTVQFILKIVSMTRKCHNHTLQTNL